MKLRFEWLILGLIAIAGILYAGLDGLPLSHPGNLKAADPFYHAISVENILDTKQWYYYPAWIAFGDKNAVNSQPPLPYIQAALLTSLSGLPSWVTFYALVVLFAALGVGLAFLITKEIFGDNRVALLASAAAVLPVSVRAWLYPIYIGLWLQVIAFTFILAFAWLGLRYWKEGKTWQLWGLNLCTAAILLTHPQDLLFLFVPWLFIVYGIFKNNHTWPNRAKQFIALVSIAGLLLLMLLPHIFLIWAGQRQLQFGWFGLQERYFDRSYLGALPMPDILYFPWFILVLAGIGILLTSKDRKRYAPWLLIAAYFAIITYLLPTVMPDPHYLSGRTRALSPFVMLPFAAYAAYNFIILISKKIKISAILLVMLISGASLVYGFMEYRQLKPQLQYEHLPADKWSAYQWMHSNVPEDSTIVLIEGGSQANDVFLKRFAAVVSLNELSENLVQLEKNRTLPLVWDVEWSAETLRHTHYRKTSIFGFEQYPEWSKEAKITDFDYLFLEDLNPEVARVNDVLIELFKQNNYDIVHKEGRFRVLRKVKA